MLSKKHTPKRKKKKEETRKAKGKKQKQNNIKPVEMKGNSEFKQLYSALKINFVSNSD